MDKVLIGCPVRNRAWILPSYLDALLNLNYPEELCEYAFIVNDCVDDTLRVLQDFALNCSSPVHLIVKDLGAKTRTSRGGFNVNGLVVLRNELLKVFLKTKCTHLFSVDSDILVKSESLRRLLELDLAIVSALVRNDHHLGNLRYFNILQVTDGHLIPIRDFPRNQVIPVDCTGAAYLIKREVIEAGVGYTKHPQGEDAGFCEEARKLGFTIWCHTGIECEHVMLSNVE
ncbi:MAG: glycosyltransferase [Candidatus Saccharibacteria bacterium]